MSIDSPQPVKVIVLTGGSGQTGNQVVEAALAQFDGLNVEVALHSKMRTAAAARRAVRQAQEDGSIICHIRQNLFFAFPAWDR